MHAETDAGARARVGTRTAGRAQADRAAGTDRTGHVGRSHARSSTARTRAARTRAARSKTARTRAARGRSRTRADIGDQVLETSTEAKTCGCTFPRITRPHTVENRVRFASGRKLRPFSRRGYFEMLVANIFGRIAPVGPIPATVIDEQFNEQLNELTATKNRRLWSVGHRIKSERPQPLRFVDD